MKKSSRDMVWHDAFAVVETRLADVPGSDGNFERTMRSTGRAAVQQKWPAAIHAHELAAHLQRAADVLSHPATNPTDRKWITDAVHRATLAFSEFAKSDERTQKQVRLRCLVLALDACATAASKLRSRKARTALCTSIVDEIMKATDPSVPSVPSAILMPAVDEWCSRRRRRWPPIQRAFAAVGIDYKDADVLRVTIAQIRRAR